MLTSSPRIRGGDSQSAGSGGTIGGIVTGGDPNDVLFIGPTGLLDQDDNFQYISASGLQVKVSNSTTGTGTFVGGKYTKFGLGAPNNTTSASSVASAVELWDSDNTNVGVQMGVGNSNAGNNAYAGYFWNNNLASDGLVDHYAFAGLNSSTYNNTTFGSGTAIANQWFVENTDGPVTLASVNSVTPQYINFLIGGAATTNEIARFTTVGMSIGAQASPTALLTVDVENLGTTTPTTAQGIVVQNQTAATNGAQQNAPALSWSSNGWGTTAGTSQNVSWKLFTTTTQSTTPSGTWILMSSVNGAAFANKLTVTTAGSGTVTGSWTTTGATATTSNIRTAIAATSSDGFISTNTTAATAGATVQWSPRLRFSGTAWNGTASNTDDFIIENQTVAGSGSTTASLVVSSQINAGGFTSVFTLANTGNISLTKTITATGTNGAQTINKTSGSVNFAASAGSLVVTNSFVTTTSVIICTVGTNDALMTSVSAVAASGSFTLFPNTAPSGAVRVNFLVTN